MHALKSDLLFPFEPDLHVIVEATIHLTHRPSLAYDRRWSQGVGCMVAYPQPQAHSDFKAFSGQNGFDLIVAYLLLLASETLGFQYNS